MKHLKTIICILMAVCILLPFLPVKAHAATDSCGENLKWTLSAQGVLTISGTGEMDNFQAWSGAPWYSFNDQIKKVVIKSGVTSIGDFAFMYCSKLTSVTIADTVTQLGWGAFYSCEALTSVSIPKGVTEIGREAFYCCKNLKSVSFSANVSSIGDQAFSYCEKLTRFSVDSSNPYFSADSKGVLFNKDKTILIQAPAGLTGHYTIPSTVHTLEYSAFAYTGISGVTIPNSVTAMKMDAFFHCKNLRSVEIPESVTTLGSRVFGSTGLTSVTVPGNIQTLSTDTFACCYDLKSAVIEEGVEIIGTSAFYECTSLETVSISKTVRSIGIIAFYKCYALKEFKVDEESAVFSNDDRGVLFDKEKTVLRIAPGGMEGSYQIPDSVTEIAADAFAFCRNLTEVTLPKNLQKIGRESFYQCSSLQDMIFTSSAPEFDGNAFYNLTTTAHYPQDMPGWEEAVQQNYKGAITWVPYTSAMLGDVDMDGDVDVDDVLALLWHVLFPDDYPIEVNAEFDRNGTTDVDDVLTLLWHVLFPEDYPL